MPISPVVMPKTATPGDAQKGNVSNINKVITITKGEAPRLLSLSEKISYEQELKRIGKELERLGNLSDHTKCSRHYNRHIELTIRRKELRQLLGVVA